MRNLHCTVALVLAAGVAAGTARAQGGARADAGTPVPFMVFINGAPVGTEEVTVVRTPDGTTINGTARLGPPLNLTLRRAQVNYAPDGTPMSCTLEGSVRDQLLGVRTVVAGTTATTDATTGTQTTHKVDQVTPGVLLLPNGFFGAYQALALRLDAAKTGDEIRGYIPPQAEIVLRVGTVAEETIRTPARAVKVRRFGIRFENPGQPFEGEAWVEAGGHLVRLVVASQGLDYARNDIVSVAARREPISHPGDEQVSFRANGFDLAGTLSKPAGTLPKGTRLPAVVLVAGGGQNDRDEAVAGIPVLGQLASALADAGFVVVRYDKRGIGQSGGRAESVTLSDYAEDVRAVVKGLRKRKDVDRKRVAIAGYGEGGAVALAAAQKDGDVAAVALLAAPGVSGADLILERQARALEKMTIPEADKQARVELQKKINQAVLAGTGWEGVPPAVRKQADTPWFQSFLAYDPAKIVPKVKQPILIVSGALDREISPANARNLETLARARKKQAGQAVRRVDLAGLNHLFVAATTGEVDEYGRGPDKTISSQLPGAIASWLGELWPRK
jgi:pimeloyl-ACP methyl ester carboxylesterase